MAGFPPLEFRREIFPSSTGGDIGTGGGTDTGGTTGGGTDTGGSTGGGTDTGGSTGGTTGGETDTGGSTGSTTGGGTDTGGSTGGGTDTGGSTGATTGGGTDTGGSTGGGDYLEVPETDPLGSEEISLGLFDFGASWLPAACPAPINIPLPAMGSAEFSFNLVCDYASMIRAFVILTALFSALHIVLGNRAS
jgi:hypothetical protein